MPFITSNFNHIKNHSKSSVLIFKVLLILIVVLIANSVRSQSTFIPAIKSLERSISLEFDNDTYYYTDYYYTYGLQIKFYHPVFNKFPWNKYLPNVPDNNLTISGLALSQKLYTPKNIRDSLVQFNDRPFAATLEINYLFENHDTLTELIIKNNIRIGVMGPAAGGGAMQKEIHDWINSPYPQGWKYQISNDVILNYDLLLSYPIYFNDFLKISALGLLRVGTCNDDLSAGMEIIISRRYQHLAQKPRFWVSLNSNLRYVFYDATMQGGLFSTNEYALKYDMLSHAVIGVSAEFGMEYSGFNLSYKHNYLTKDTNTQKYLFIHSLFYSD